MARPIDGAAGHKPPAARVSGFPPEHPSADLRTPCVAGSRRHAVCRQKHRRQVPPTLRQRKACAHGRPTPHGVATGGRWRFSPSGLAAEGTPSRNACRFRPCRTVAGATSAWKTVIRALLAGTLFRASSPFVTPPPSRPGRMSSPPGRPLPGAPCEAPGVTLRVTCEASGRCPSGASGRRHARACVCRASCPLVHTRASPCLTAASRPVVATPVRRPSRRPVISRRAVSRPCAAPRPAVPSVPWTH